MYMMKLVPLLVLISLCLAGSIKISHLPTSGIKYEAENAFVNVIADDTVLSACQLGSDIQKKLSGSVLHISPESYTIFSVNIPQDGEYDVTLSAYACGDSFNTLDVYANGHPLLLGEKVLLDDTNSVVHKLQLRFGLNTIRYHVHGENAMAFDFISVKGGIPIKSNGATVNFEEIEAENANYKGTKIGPSRVYTTLPSEAGGRSAVQLSSGGSVEFTPTKSFNAIVVRYSIPMDKTTSLNLLVNGQQQTTLNVTSYTSWAFGTKNQYTRDPSAGFPHHFYDDVRYHFKSTYPAGTKVSVVSSSSLLITVDLADFYTVPAPYTMPANFISVTDYGADPTGKQDAGGPFQNAFNGFRQKNAAGIWIPAGTYSFSYRLNLQDKFVIRGAGPWYTELHGHNFGFDGQSSNGAGLYDFAVFGNTQVRNDGESSSGVGSSINNGQIQNLWIEHNKVGMWLNGPFTGLHISGVTIRNTFADGINFNIGVTNSMVEQSVIRNVGDDCLAMWANGGNYGQNVFKFNTVSFPLLANTIAIYGGTGNSATDNYCSDTLLEGAGLQVGTRFGSTPLGGTTTFARNTLVRTGSSDMYNPVNVEGAIWIYSDSQPTNTPILFEDITVTDSYFQVVEFFQQDVSNVNFTNIVIDGAKYLWDTQVGVNIYAKGVVATNVNVTLNNCLNKPFKITDGGGNKGWDLKDTKCEQ